MADRFKNSYELIPGPDIELALMAEAEGKEELLNGILSRQIHASDFVDEPF